MVIHGDFSEDSGSEAIAELLESGTAFSAVFAANDQMAIGAALRLSQAGIRIPQDVSIMGFDDLQASKFFIPPLTTIHQPSAEIGSLTVAAMLKLLAGETPDHAMPLPELVIRDSTAPAIKKLVNAH